MHKNFYKVYLKPQTGIVMTHPIEFVRVAALSNTEIENWIIDEYPKYDIWKIKCVGGIFIIEEDE